MGEPTASTKLFITIAEFALLVGKTRRTIAGLVASGEIASVKLGHSRLIPKQEIDLLVTKSYSARESTKVSSQAAEVRA